MITGKVSKYVIVLAAASASIAGSSAACAAPILLAPISPWNADWGESTCSLRRLFGTKEKESLLVMERYGPTDAFHLTIVSDEFKSFQQGETLWLKFGDGERQRIADLVPGKSGKGKATLFFNRQSLAAPISAVPDAWVPAVTPATEAATKTISVTYYGRERIFAVGPLDKPFAALRKCTDNLVASWGLDPKQQAQLTRYPAPLTNPAYWIRSDDYPRAMLNIGKQALVNFRLSVDAQGLPTACEVQRSYNDKKFDEVTCAVLMRRARFSPAKDHESKPIASYYLNTVRWIMSF